MTTPNEELITDLQGLANEIEISYRIEVIEEAAEALQSQAERIADLERESETHAKAYGLAIVERDNLRHELKTAQEGWRCECSTDDACRFARERDTLRAQLAEIKRAEPVVHQFQTREDGNWHDFLDDDHYHNTVEDGRWPIRELFTRPMPVESNAELVKALQLFADALPLDKSAVKTCYAITDQMRDAAHAALAKAKGAK